MNLGHTAGHRLWVTTLFGLVGCGLFDSSQVVVGEDSASASGKGSAGGGSTGGSASPGGGRTGEAGKEGRAGEDGGAETGGEGSVSGGAAGEPGNGSSGNDSSGGAEGESGGASGMAGASNGGSGGSAGGSVTPEPKACATDALGLNGVAATALVRAAASAVAGDFDQDGKLDLATVSGDVAVVSVFLGRGDGTFEAGDDSASLAAATLIKTGDFNGDGSPDLAVLQPGQIGILLGHGDGSFELPVVTEVGTDTKDIAVGDWNGDGKQDLAASGYGAIRLLLSDGDGSFTARGDYPRGGNSIAAGDLDRDGNLDLVVATGALLVFLGNGDGTFESSGEFSATLWTDFVALVDLNGDGDLDIAASAECPHTLAYSSTLLGNGDGTFQAPLACEAWPACDTPGPAVSGDLDGNGVQDLIAGPVLLGNGDGTLVAAPLSFGSGELLGDFTGDGKLDVVGIADGAWSPGVDFINVFAGNGDGSFGPKLVTGTTGYADAVAFAQLNGDGALDRVIANQVLRVELGNGDGTFTLTKEYLEGVWPSDVAVGDLDRDGHQDLVVVQNSSSVTILRGIGDGSFAEPTYATTGMGSRGVALGDNDGDGNLDIITWNFDANSVSVLLSNGDGTFAGHLDYGFGNGTPSDLTVGDFDGDTRSDIAVTLAPAVAEQSLVLLRSAGDGTLVKSYESFGSLSGLAVGDVDGSGTLDIVAPSLAGIHVLIGNGDGTFERTVVTTNSLELNDLSLGDLDGDGNLDIAIAGQALSVLFGTGDGLFGCTTSYLPLPSNSGFIPEITLADVNYDAKLDIAATSFNKIQLLLNRRD